MKKEEIKSGDIVYVNQGNVKAKGKVDIVREKEGYCFVSINDEVTGWSNHKYLLKNCSKTPITTFNKAYPWINLTLGITMMGLLATFIIILFNGDLLGYLIAGFVLYELISDRLKEIKQEETKEKESVDSSNTL